MIKVRAIGAAEVQIGRRRITAKTEVVLALAVYLCVRAGERLSRDEVVEVFWPEADATKGRHNLRQLLYRLRQRGFVLDEEGEELWLDPGRVESDLTTVLAQDWPASAVPSDIESASNVLPNLCRAYSESFQDWIDGLRSTVALQFRRAALQQISRARSEGRWSDLDKWGLLLLKNDPLNEEATLARAESAAMSGSKTIALEILDRYVEDLGHRAGSLALPAAVLRRRIAERKIDWGRGSSHDLPLTGRATEMRSITGAIDLARNGTGCALLLVGAPGIGKTRLCTEVRNYSMLAGYRSLLVRTDPGTSSRKFGLASAIAVALTEVPGAAAMSTAALAVLRQLSEPDLVAVHQHPTSPSLTQDTLAWALSEALSAASHEGPVLLVVDDLHYGDDTSTAVLAQLAPACSAMRAVVLMTSRPAWTQDSSRIQQGWNRVRRVHLAPLARHEAVSLATAVSSTLTRPLSPSVRDEIALTAGGNPLFLRELAAHRSVHPNGTTLPRTLASVIEERLSQLTPAETRVVRLTALLGPYASPARLFKLTHHDATPLADTLEALERDGLIHLDPAGTLTLHDCWREAAETAVPRAARAALALECATLLHAEHPSPHNVDLCWRVGSLYDTAGDSQRSAMHFEMAGELLLAMGMPEQASEAFERASSSHASTSKRGALLASLARAHHAAANFVDARKSAQAAIELLQTDGGAELEAAAHACAILADASWKVQNDASTELAQLGVLVRHPKLTAATREYASLLGIRITFADDGRWAQVFRDATRFDPTQASMGWAGLLVNLIYAAERGTSDDVRSAAAALQQASWQELPAHVRSMILRHQAVALRFIGDYEEAVRLGEIAVATSVESGHRSDAVGAALALAFAHLDYCNPSAAAEWISRAEDLSEPATHDERERSFSHATGRLLLARADYSGCMEHYHRRISSVLHDKTQRRRAVECACIAVAASQCGHPQVAREALAAAAAVLEADQPNAQLDFCADAMVTSLRLLGRDGEASTTLHSYLARRRDSFPRPIAPCLLTLRGAATNAPS